MANPRKKGELSRGFWIGASLGATAVVLALALSVRSPPPPEQRRPSARPSVGLVGDAASNALLREKASLSDPTPLFLPTDKNAAQSVRPESGTPGDTFHGYPAQLVAELQQKVEGALPTAVAVPKTPVEASEMTDWSMPLAGFGRRDVPPPALAARGACVEVVAAGDGQSLLAAELPEAKPPSELEWQPLEFLAAVTPAGLVESPTLVVSSGVEKVDQYFLEYMTKRWRVGERLAKLASGPALGFYRIKLGP
jgi:hypothetical protein